MWSLFVFGKMGELQHIFNIDILVIDVTYLTSITYYLVVECMAKNKADDHLSWLLFFYTLPSKPVRSRMKIWRKLLNTGALPFKNSVYILPYTEEHHEFLTWLVTEILSLKGEGSFVRVEKIEMIDNQQIITLFNQQRESDYRHIQRKFDEIERNITSARSGGASLNKKNITHQIRKCQRDFENIRKIDFFISERGLEVGERLEKIVATLNGLTGIETTKQAVTIVPARIEDYQNKIWATRKRPFVDRFASAWLIKKFIDKNASFTFIDEKDGENMGKDIILFDIRGGRFTHTADLCTFEVLIKSFSLKDKTLRKVAEIVHELDLKDNKFRTPEAKGIENILYGIRKTAKNDYESMERGTAIFEMLYASHAG